VRLQRIRISVSLFSRAAVPKPRRDPGPMRRRVQPLGGDARWPVQKRNGRPHVLPTVRAVGMRHAQTADAMLMLAVFGVNPNWAM
jgi:hypothetical protein